MSLALQRAVLDSASNPLPVVVLGKQECADPCAPDGRSWLVLVRCRERRLHRLLLGGDDGAPLHYNGAAGARAPAPIERVAYELVFAERASELLAALDASPACMASGA